MWGPICLPSCKKSGEGLASTPIRWRQFQDSLIQFTLQFQCSSFCQARPIRMFSKSWNKYHKILQQCDRLVCSLFHLFHFLFDGQNLCPFDLVFSRDWFLLIVLNCFLFSFRFQRSYLFFKLANLIGFLVHLVKQLIVHSFYILNIVDKALCVIHPSLYENLFHCILHLLSFIGLLFFVLEQECLPWLIKVLGHRL